MKKDNLLVRWIPKYAFLPLILMISFNFVTYFGTRLFTTDLFHYDMSNPIDNRIPFVPAFMSVYLLAFAQWAIGYIIIARESKEVCWKVVIGEMIAKCICLICFLVFPTTIVRPEVTGNGFWEWVTRLIYQIDAADNLFPSIHCLESWMCFRGALYLKKVPGWYRYVMLTATLLVFASTVLVKQHVVLDILGAVAAVEFGLFISRSVLKDRFLSAK